MVTWAHLAVLAAALLTDAVVQVTTSRLLISRENGWLLSLAAGYAAGGVLTVAAAAVWVVSRAPDRADAAAAAAAVLLAYAGFGFFYANVVNGGRTALRVRLLAELRDAPPGLTAAEVIARYRPEEMFEVRVARLIASGQVALRDGRVRLQPGALLIVRRLVTAAKLVVIGKRSEFD